MEISGKIIAVPPLQSGQGKNGLWRSQDFVIETGGQYPKKVCLNLFNDKIDKFPVALDEEVTVNFDIESREYKGRWYTTLRAWNVKKKEESIAPGDLPPADIIGEPSADFSSSPFGDSDSDGNTPLPF